MVPDPALVVADLADAALADAAVGTLFRTTDPPTALFTARDAVTVAALRALQRLGLQRLVAVVGFGDFVTADLLSPGITVVAQDPAGIGPTGRVPAVRADGGRGRAARDPPRPDRADPARLGELPPPPR